MNVAPFRFRRWEHLLPYFIPGFVLQWLYLSPCTNALLLFNSINNLLAFKNSPWAGMARWWRYNMGFGFVFGNMLCLPRVLYFTAKHMASHLNNAVPLVSHFSIQHSVSKWSTDMAQYDPTNQNLGGIRLSARALPCQPTTAPIPMLTITSTAT